MKLLSIIVPVYNVEDYLEQCLKSIGKQLTAEVEVIVIDDGSTDGSHAICLSFANNFNGIKVIQQTNQGLSAARNTGMTHAAGQFIWYVDSDDWIASNAIEKLLNHIKQYPTLDVVRFGFTLFDDQTSLAVEQYKYKKIQNICSNTYFQTNEMLYQAWAGIYKRSFLLEKNIVFPEGKIYEDIAFNLLVYANKAQMDVLPEQLYWYRIRVGSLLRSAVDEKKINSIAHILTVCDQLIKKFEYNKADATIAIRKKLDYLYLYIDHLYAYSGFTAAEKEIAFYSLNHHIPLIRSDSKGLIWSKLVLRFKPSWFYKKRLLTLSRALANTEM